MKKPGHAEDPPAVRREQTEAGSPLLMDRRGFLHRSALVIGAFLVGLGRAEPAFGQDMTAVSCCILCCRNDPECKYKKSHCVVWHCWFEQKMWNCIECYDTARTRQAAGGNCDPNNRGQTWCSNVDCSKAEKKTGDLGRLDGGISARERLWQSYDEAGIGCQDPETGEYIIWSEPGTPCDARDPGPPEPSPPELG